MNIGKISSGAIVEWQGLRKRADFLEGQILDRITYIIRFWMETFGGKLETWYFDGAAEGDVGDLRHYMSGTTIHNICTICKPNPNAEMVIIDKDGDEYAWESEIPTRWLYEDFEQEIVNGKTLFEAREKQRKEEKALKKKNQKEADMALVELAKSKLTKEELAALKKTL